MNLLQKARALEARLAGTFDRTVGGFVRANTREPIEIVHAVIEAATEEVQPSGRGRRVFPFNELTLTILAPSRDVRARFEAVLADGPSLRDRIASGLASAGCAVNDLEVTVKYDSQARKGWRHPEFHLEFARAARNPILSPEPAPTSARVEATVLNGAAERRTYVLPARSRIDIGRCVEVRDSHHRLIRTNHIAFVEGSNDVNRTVSRRHAHISYDQSLQSFRLHDDGSEHGTSIVRNGRNLPVLRGARGVRLESGDEIVLGEARLSFRVSPKPSPLSLEP